MRQAVVDDFIQAFEEVAHPAGGAGGRIQPAVVLHADVQVGEVQHADRIAHAAAAVAIHPALQPLRRCVGRQPIQQRRGGTLAGQQRAVDGVDEALGAGVLDQRQQRFEVALDVQQADRLAVHPDLRPGQDLKQLFKGAEPAGERHEGVPDLRHVRLALMHRIDQDHFAQGGVGQGRRVELPRHDAHHGASGLQGCVGHGAHHPGPASAIDQRQAALDQRPPHRPRRLQVDRPDVVTRTAVHHHALHTRLHSTMCEADRARPRSSRPGADPFGDGLARLPARHRGRRPAGAGIQTHPWRSRDHVQMTVEDRLSGRHPIGQQQVHPVARQAGSAQRCRQPARRRDHPAGVGFVQVLQPGCMPVGDHQQMTFRNRMRVHEGRDRLVPIDQAGLGLTGDDSTEDACRRGGS